MASSRHSFSVEPQASAREVPGAPRRAFVVGALAGFAACAGLAALLLFRGGALAPGQAANFAGAPAVPKPALAGYVRGRAAPTSEADSFDAFDSALDNLGRPVLAIISGDEVDGNAGLIDSLLDKVDRMVIGGGMAAAFLEAANSTAAAGGPLRGGEGAASALELMGKAKDRGVEMILPVDFATPRGLGGGGAAGPRSAELRRAAVGAAETVVWNCATERDPLQQDADFCGDCWARRDHRRLSATRLPPPPVDSPGEWVPRAEFKGFKSFSFYRCKVCSKTWVSAHGHKLKYKQGCKLCEQKYQPLFMWRNDHKRKDDDELEAVRLSGHHDRARCEACRAGVCTAP